MSYPAQETAAKGDMNPRFRNVDALLVIACEAPTAGRPS